MEEVERVKKALKVISTHGDLYDVIAKAKNVKPTSSGFARLHVLLFSRILFAGVLVKDKIRSYFSPVEKVHDAQEEIRSLLGFNVDLIKDKTFRKMSLALYDNRKEVSILYEDKDIYMDDYVSNIQKLLTFISVHGIKKVYLFQDDIINLFPGINLSSFKGVERSSIIASLTPTIGGSLVSELARPYDEDEELEESDVFLMLENCDLKRLLDLISTYKVDKKFVASLGNRIDDISIQNALEEYYETGDLPKLKKVILSRLCLNINSDSSYKSREYGKAYDSVIIQDEFIKVTTTFKNSNKIESSVMLLCEYLGYPNYETLLRSLDRPQDDEQRVLMATLYLYLCKQTKVKRTSVKNSESFFDSVYNSYLETKTGQKKKVDNLIGKGNKIGYNIFYYFIALYFTAVICALGIVSGFAADFINSTFFGNDTSVAKTLIEYVITPYKYSWGLEKQIIDTATDEVDNISIALNDVIAPIIGDDLSFLKNDEKVIGVVRPIDVDNYDILPHYFAVEYGASSEYQKGNITYDLQEVPMNYHNFSPYVQTLFSTEVYFSRRELKEMIDGNVINIPLALHPVDNSYRLTAVLIYDEKDNNKRFEFDAIRAWSWGGKITDEEKALLLSMKKPAIRYYYGISEYYLNAFIQGVQKDGSYLETSALEMRNIITSALELPPGATLNDIFVAIKSKDYSTTPFKDAGLSRKIKKMDEKEFISTVASMDSLICNLAATLAVETKDDLVYVVGFHTDDNVITYGGAHAWAMDEYGIIIDVTPSSDEDKKEDDIDAVLAWFFQSPLPITAALTMLSLYLSKKIGKKIVFTIKAFNVNRLLTSANIGETYSFIYDTLYGGINLPMDYDAEEFLTVIAKDYEGYTKKELEEQLALLKEAQSKYKGTARKVVKSVPFIKANEGELKRSLQKKKKKR